jgi:hypothetical protein|tara:strand:- start:441 stop:695 length:255 start_codon:yes stop_codon:yes gene_type:complete
MIYKVHFKLDETGGSAGYCYAGSKASAIREIKSWEVEGHWPHYTYESQENGTRADIEITTYPTPRTKAAWIEFLNDHGGHPDNG